MATFSTIIQRRKRISIICLLLYLLIIMDDKEDHLMRDSYYIKFEFNVDALPNGCFIDWFQ
jgi:hypothetical protein